MRKPCNVDCEAGSEADFEGDLEANSYAVIMRCLTLNHI